MCNNRDVPKYIGKSTKIGFYAKNKEEVSLLCGNEILTKVTQPKISYSHIRNLNF